MYTICLQFLSIWYKDSKSWIIFKSHFNNLSILNVSAVFSRSRFSECLQLEWCDRDFICRETGKLSQLSDTKRVTAVQNVINMESYKQRWRFQERKELFVQFSSVAQLCPTLVTPWTAGHQASLSITNSQSLFKLMSIKLVMPSNHLILCHPLFLLPLIFPNIRVFSKSVLHIRSQFFTSGGRNIGVSASASVLPMNIQDWSPLGWTGWISLQSKGLSRVFSNTTVQKHQFLSTQLSL